MGHRSRTETLELLTIRCTDKAVLVSDGSSDEPVWLPFSQIIEPDERYIRETVGNEIELELPNWLAEEKGLL